MSMQNDDSVIRPLNSIARLFKKITLGLIDMLVTCGVLTSRLTIATVGMCISTTSVYNYLIHKLPSEVLNLRRI
jgi:hypothetical protein